MSGSWVLKVYEGPALLYSAAVEAEPIEIGRQKEGEAGPFHVCAATGCRRVVVAPSNDDTVSRRHALLEPLGDEKVRLTNLSKKLTIRLAHGAELKPGEACESSFPALLTVGPKMVCLEADSAPDERLESLAEVTASPGVGADASVQLRTMTSAAAAGPLAETLIRWLQAAQEVLQSAASSADFFDRAARALVGLVGLDSGRVLLLRGGEWKVECLHTAPDAPPAPLWRPSRQILVQLRQEKRTFWIVPAQSAADTASLLGVETVVASPLLDVQGRVIGALYGDRRRVGPWSPAGAARGAPPIGRIEALLVELLAGGVAAGLARLEHERAATAARIQFEQFFTPELSRRLIAEPGLLDGKECEVTILVCDLRGFSRVSERLDTTTTLRWLHDVLGVLSDCVLDREGVLVDYTGDELMAMWGAPRDQPTHARLACDAALDMLGRLPELDARWRESVGGPTEVGIGVNTGPARVGNTGSYRKFKYGPHGATVNLASRVQGATKHLRTAVLITGATQERLAGALPTRRLCRARVVNMLGPVELHQLAPPGQPHWPELKAAYESALGDFETGADRKAVGRLGALLNEFPDDGPSLVLLSRAVQAVIAPPAGRESIWELPGK